MATITASEHDTLSRFILTHFGITVPPQKRLLLENRLGSILRKRGLSSVAQYCDQVLSNPSQADLQELINQVSTNYTYFNREPAHFDYLQKQVLPQLAAQADKTGRKMLRMWCAAAATGEEPCMLMMCQREFFGHRFETWDAGLLATDISAQALATARRGIYDTEQVEALPVKLRRKYFAKADGDHFRAKPALMSEITYRRFNLTTDPYPFKTRFDVIFCRNVMIYFDQNVRDAVVKKLHAQLNPSGHLFVGHSEALNDTQNRFEMVSPAVYRRK